VSEEPTVDQLRRYLQEQLIEAENIVGTNAKKERMLKLETALNEAIKFTNEVAIRNEIESLVFEEASSVRLISTSKDISEENYSSQSECPKCEEEMDAKLGFCQVCGYKSK
tara:strand:- start:1983 stop:2315 length:333 start_codon:yes stop_codon:yes gene_type:complete